MSVARISTGIPDASKAFVYGYPSFAEFLRVLFGLAGGEYTKAFPTSVKRRPYLILKKSGSGSNDEWNPERQAKCHYSKAIIADANTTTRQTELQEQVPNERKSPKEGPLGKRARQDRGGYTCLQDEHWSQSQRTHYSAPNGVQMNNELQRRRHKDPTVQRHEVKGYSDGNTATRPKDPGVRYSSAPGTMEEPRHLDDPQPNRTIFSPLFPQRQQRSTGESLLLCQQENRPK
ncbi:hypothetical protein DL98DRAFT_597825 [Cadophora sp. DSE1049]|nr:hypothetical protein DL98DRAFT_597825 [Cadophora sp. DSE1049]